jgi:hypothetical protein
LIDLLTISANVIEFACSFRYLIYPIEVFAHSMLLWAKKLSSNIQGIIMMWIVLRGIFGNFLSGSTE